LRPMLDEKLDCAIQFFGCHMSSKG
jgi:hypothetical protein